MSEETVKLLDALLTKAASAGWIPLEQASKAWQEVRKVRVKPRVTRTSDKTSNT